MRKHLRGNRGTRWLAILLTATSLKLLGVWWALTLTSVIKGVIFVCAFYWVVRKIEEKDHESR